MVTPATQRGYDANSNIDSDDMIILIELQCSDSFDPNRSTKSNRGDVWIKTVTFISELFGSNRLEDTFLNSIGLKYSCHDYVERNFIEDTNELSSGINTCFYSVRRGKYVHVYLKVIVSLGDQPERREMKYLMGGNSTFFPKFFIFCKCWILYGLFATIQWVFEKTSYPS